MRQIFIDFEWQKDNEGYRLLAPVLLAPPKKYIHPIFRFPVEESLLGRDWGKPQRIARRGGRLVSYRPLDQFHSLFKLFANAATDAPGLLGFVNKFGPLTTAGLDKDRGEPVELMLEHANAMREWLGYSVGDRSRLVEQLALEHGGVPLSSMTVRLTLDPNTRKPRLRLTPRSLLDALWVQLGQISIQRPERSARAERFFPTASHLVSKRPIWLADAPRPETFNRVACGLLANGTPVPVKSLLGQDAPKDLSASQVLWELQWIADSVAPDEWPLALAVAANSYGLKIPWGGTVQQHIYGARDFRPHLLLDVGLPKKGRGRGPFSPKVEFRFMPESFCQKLLVDRFLCIANGIEQDDWPVALAAQKRRLPKGLISRAKFIFRELIIPPQIIPPQFEIPPFVWFFIIAGMVGYAFFFAIHDYERGNVEYYTVIFYRLLRGSNLCFIHLRSVNIVFISDKIV
jgi:hypothetical protein